MALNILDEAEIEKIEKRLSEKYKKPIGIDIKRERNAWYDIERLILELKYMSVSEMEAIANSEKCVKALKELHHHLQLLLKTIKVNRK